MKPNVVSELWRGNLTSLLDELDATLQHWVLTYGETPAVSVLRYQAASIQEYAIHGTNAVIEFIEDSDVVQVHCRTAHGMEFLLSRGVLQAPPGNNTPCRMLSALMAGGHLYLRLD